MLLRRRSFLGSAAAAVAAACAPTGVPSPQSAVSVGPLETTTIRVASPAGKGSTFAFTIPLAPLSSTSASP